jgi:hypothetical protein
VDEPVLLPSSLDRRGDLRTKSVRSVADSDTIGLLMILPKDDVDRFSFSACSSSARFFWRRFRQMHPMKNTAISAITPAIVPPAITAAEGPPLLPATAVLLLEVSAPAVAPLPVCAEPVWCCTAVVAWLGVDVCVGVGAVLLVC